MLEKDKKIQPGDLGYPGGIIHTTVRINGQNKDVRTEKDINGNVTSVIITDKILGIF